MSPVLRTTAGAAIAVVGVGLGFFSYRQLHRPQTSLQVAPAPPAAAAPADGDADASAAPAPRPIPDTLPDVTLHDLTGAVKSLRSFGSRPLIVNFWASWCEPCRREIPLLRALRSQYSQDRLEIVGVAIDTQAAITDFLRGTPIDYPVLVGEEDGLAAVEKFGMQPVLPFSVFVDRRGTVVAVKIGELHREEAEFILGTLHSLAAGAIALPEAREHIAQHLRELAVARSRSGVTVSN